ncbi:hypothetical protein H0H93_003150 [Arthromyces matolae]|nr:hypothetical protein H0H93_003150 [Arthromyces matolae]
MENSGHGQGWAGDCGEVISTKYAELLVDMYTSTLHAVNEQGLDLIHHDLPLDTRSRLIKSMEKWDFEPHKLPEEELLACTLILFEVLYRVDGMEEAIGVSMKQIIPFVYHLRRIYRLENSYHNFEHALDVLQALYSYLRAAGMVPPLSILHKRGRKWTSSRSTGSAALVTSLGLHDLFVLYIAAIGHDVGHPGFTNAFMKNASTPLSEVYDGKSALEQMHSQLLLRVMRYHGLGVVLDHPKTGIHVRRLLWETILATDMSVHELFMKNLRGVIDGQANTLFFRQSITCQTLMKCADISNPSRPYHVAKHWASALMEEWSSQALYEKFLDLPTTVQSTDSPINEAKAQVFFISAFAKPLLDLTIQAIPEMRPFGDQCTTNLRIWTKRLKCLENDQNDRNTQSSTTPRHPDDFMTVFPLTLPPAHRASHLEDSESVPPWSSARSSDSSSDSGLCSPSGSVTSFIFSPASESSSNSHLHSYSSHSQSNAQSQVHHSRPPSSIGGSSTLGPLPPPQSPYSSESHAAIRAAGKLGIRKQRSMNRNSWSPSAVSHAERISPPPLPITFTKSSPGSLPTSPTPTPATTTTTTSTMTLLVATPPNPNLLTAPVQDIRVFPIFWSTTVAYTRPGLRPRIDVSQVPSPIQLVEEDRLKWEDQAYGTLPGNYAPASTSDYIAIDQGTASPKFARVTTWKFPSSSRLADECQIPLAAVFQPFAELDPVEEPVPLVETGDSGPARCGKCRAYVNPWCSLDANLMRLDQLQRPELSKGVVDFAVPEEYWAINPAQGFNLPYHTFEPQKPGSSRPPKPMNYIFAFDVSNEAVKYGFFRSACACVSRLLFGGTTTDGASFDACFPPESSAAFLTYDSMIHFYDLSTSTPRMLVVPDIEEVFVPLKEGLFVKPNQRRETLESFLESLPSRFENTPPSNAALGSLLRTCQASLVSNRTVIRLLAHSVQRQDKAVK